MIRSILDKIKRLNNPLKYWISKGLVISFEDKNIIDGGGGYEIEIYPSANLGSEPYLIEIGNHVRINGGVQMITHDGGAYVLRNYLKEANCDQLDLFGKIKIGSNVHIGTNAIIMPGVEIGDNCIIGCGAIVTKNIPSGSIAVGVPAKVIETIDEYVEKNRYRFQYTKQLNSLQKRQYLTNKFTSLK